MAANENIANVVPTNNGADSSRYVPKIEIVTKKFIKLYKQYIII